MPDKHRVLVFGQKVFGLSKPTLSVEHCEIEIISFPEEYQILSSLAEYTLVILDYSAFASSYRQVFDKEQDIFLKQMVSALDKGTCFCILHYDEEVPRTSEYGWGSGNMEADDLLRLQHLQIGLRILFSWDIRPTNLGTIITR